MLACPSLKGAGRTDTAIPQVHLQQNHIHMSPRDSSNIEIVVVIERIIQETMLKALPGGITLTTLTISAAF